MTSVCGVCGFQLKPGADVDARELAAFLLLGIEERGQDATGVAWWGPNEGALCFDKAPLEASKFVQHLQLSKDSRTVIGHTRLATQGKPEFNRNNHPVRVGTKKGDRIVGVHNGVIWNDYTLWKDITRTLTPYGDVDTEALFAHLWETSTDGPIDLTEVEGSYAIAYLREEQPGVLYLARGQDSPLCIAYSDMGVFFASTVKALETIEGIVGPYHRTVDGSTSKTGVFSFKEGQWGQYVDGEEKVFDVFKYNKGRYFRSYGSYGNDYGRYGYGTWDDEGEVSWDYSQSRRERVDKHAVALGVCRSCYHWACTHVCAECWMCERDNKATANSGRTVFSERTQVTVGTVDERDDAIRLENWLRHNSKEAAEDQWDKVPDSGTDYRLSHKAMWVDTYPHPSVPDTYYHMYDDDNYIQNESPMPPFWVNRLPDEELAEELDDSTPSCDIAWDEYDQVRQVIERELVNS